MQAQRGVLEGAAEGAMRDTVHCSGLRLNVQIGFHPHERERLQQVEVDLSIETDFRAGPERDDHQGLVDYERVVLALQASVLGKRFDLIEALAVHLTREVLRLHPTTQVRIRVTKRPAGLPQVGSVSAECIRTASDWPAEADA